MMAIDFDDAINESKRPRKDEDAERKKQEREDARVAHQCYYCPTMIDS